MMLSKISLVASLLFFLFGNNVFAHSHLEDPIPTNETVHTESVDDMAAFTVATVSVNQAETVATANEDSKKETNHANVLTKKASTNEPSFKDYVVPFLVGLISVIGFGSYWLIFRRKHI